MGHMKCLTEEPTESDTYFTVSFDCCAIYMKNFISLFRDSNTNYLSKNCSYHILQYFKVILVGL